MPIALQIIPRRKSVLSTYPTAQSTMPTGATGGQVTCLKCNLRETCLSGGVPAKDLDRIENIVYARRRIARGEHLYRSGDTFRTIYAIRKGFFKTNHLDTDGREQVTGFYMSGELLGMDGLGRGLCESTAVALEDSDVCAMPYALIEEIGRDIPELQRRLYSVLAREIQRDHGVMLLLGSMSAEERLAAFLVNLSMRFESRGCSGLDFELRMTRQDIGSYLGLKHETVSRLFSSFQKTGLIEVRHKRIAILDSSGLEQVLKRGR